MSISAMTMDRQKLLFDSCNIKSFHNKFSVVNILLLFVFIQISSAQDVPLRILETHFQGRLGHNATISCLVEPEDVQVDWTFANKVIDTNHSNFRIMTENVPGKPDADGNKQMAVRHTLVIHRTRAQDHGRWGCVAKRGEGDGGERVEADGALLLTIPTRLVSKSMDPVRLKLSESANLTCVFEGFNLTTVKWRKLENTTVVQLKIPSDRMISQRLNETHIKGTLSLIDVNRKENGTYLCGVFGTNTNKIDEVTHTTVLILEAPQITIDFMMGVGEKKIFLNWTVNNGNSPIKSYDLRTRQNGSESWVYSREAIKPPVTSFVITDLLPNQGYQVRISASNEIGMGKPYVDNRWITTLDKDPVFIPEVTIKGFTFSSMTVGWTPPPPNLTDYFHYYELTALETNNTDDKTTSNKIHKTRTSPYMFEDLAPNTLYTFKVRACSEFTNECGDWSPPGNATTMDGASGVVTSPTMTCIRDSVSGVSSVNITWQPPVKPNGIIKSYQIEMTGTATFINDEGRQERTVWGPMSRSVSEHSPKTVFNSVPHNTNFTVKINAITRAKTPGQMVILRCGTPVAPPSRDWLQGFHWNKIQETDGRWLFKLYVPRVTERNGAICCYRVVVVRMKQEQKLSDIPSPEHLQLSSYKNVHINGHGAYVADVFSSTNFHSQVIVGDGRSLASSERNSLGQCEMCRHYSGRLTPIPLIPITPPPAPITTTPGQITTTTTEKTTVVPNLTQVPNVAPEEFDKKIEDLLANTAQVSEDELLPKKSKRHFPTAATSHAEDKTLFKNLDQYVNTQPDSENVIRQMDASYVGDQKFLLDDNYFITKRISHQNKKKQQSEDYSDKLVKNLQKQDDTWFSDDYSRSDIESLDHDDGDFVAFPNNDEEDIEDDVVPERRFVRVRDYMDPHHYESYFDRHSAVTKRGTKSDSANRHNSKYASINHKRSARDTLREEHRRRLDLGSYRFRIDPRIFIQNPGFFDDFNNLHTDLRPGLYPSSRDAMYNRNLQKYYSDSNLPERRDELRPQGGSVPLEPLIFDGQLDENSNYTGFVELLVHTGDHQAASVYSNYFNVLNPGPDEVPSEPLPWSLIIMIVFAVGLGIVAILFAIALWVLRMQNRRNICQGFRGGRHMLVNQTPPDLPPIAKQDLLNAYMEREIDSGYKFQHEFERLPDCFNDRTMDVSEAKENQGKNRYPDIKAYDQTRVKLSMIEGVLGSDYINANYVMGYKERKKFICAQGPTEVTVDDFWRMIWEQNLELVVMLTNLEECSKVKCAKYWPDQNNAQKVYAGSIHVQHIGEKRYSDYIVRELKITKRSLSESNSHVIEANGVKKNGEVTNGNGAVNTGTGANGPEERIVKQYHYLMWKDFVAPEHPHAILKFIKRVNEAALGGKTILVHCSAGVGRTGTMVALDCLKEQLDAEGQVTVFNTVCDLRRQRNYLVQSLKQYVFIYRALVEYAMYPDTEIPVIRLKTTVDRLRQIDTCEMEEEFDKVKQGYLENQKPCNNGQAPEHIAKNRSEAVVPYDHNRVILAPIATKEHSTYVNASFIEGYDNAESYIIAQDPLPTTLADFWRMVLEQEISTIVMLSELGEGKCPRYWDDEEIQYDHMSVRYMQSESCPYYTRREFVLTNTKNQERLNVTQLQYHGWPTVSGQVPEVTRGLIELIGQSGAAPPTTSPILVHCSLGTDRSSMFVALCILITQLRTEQRVDVSTVTRKLRTQRLGCLDTFLQYEFLYRAIVNYAELHNLLTGSS